LGAGRAGHAGAAGIGKKTIKKRQNPFKNTRFREGNTAFLMQNRFFLRRIF